MVCRSQLTRSKKGGWEQRWQQRGGVAHLLLRGQRLQPQQLPAIALHLGRERELDLGRFLDDGLGNSLQLAQRMVPGKGRDAAAGT